MRTIGSKAPYEAIRSRLYICEAIVVVIVLKVV